MRFDPCIEAQSVEPLRFRHTTHTCARRIGEASCSVRIGEASRRAARVPSCCINKLGRLSLCNTKTPRTELGRRSAGVWF